MCLNEPLNILFFQPMELEFLHIINSAHVLRFILVREILKVALNPTLESLHPASMVSC